MRMISLVLASCAIIVANSYGQQQPYGYRTTGLDGVYSRTIQVEAGSVLDSAVNWMSPGTRNQSYAFEYGKNGRLMQDSNLFARVIPRIQSGGRYTNVHQAGRNQYWYDAKGRVDSIARTFWVDSLWMADSTGWKYRYSLDGSLLSKTRRSITSPRPIEIEMYVYDSDGNQIADSLIVQNTSAGGYDTICTVRQFDSKKRLLCERFRRSDTPTSMRQATYQYISEGEIRTVWSTQYPDTTIIDECVVFTIDSLDRVTNEVVWTGFADSHWTSCFAVPYAYDQDQRVISRSVANWFSYDGDGDVDTLVMTHPVYSNFLGARFQDSFGNELALPDYSGTTILYYHSGLATVERGGGNVGGFELAQNYPNPFNPATTIVFEIPRTTMVKLAIYDVLGREVKILVQGMRPAGRHSESFNAHNLASGVYLFRLQAGEFVQTRKLCVVK